MNNSNELFNVSMNENKKSLNQSRISKLKTIMNPDNKEIKKNKIKDDEKHPTNNYQDNSVLMNHIYNEKLKSNTSEIKNRLNNLNNNS